MKIGAVGWGMMLLLAPGCDAITAVESESGSTSGGSATGNPETQTDPTNPSATMTTVGVSTSPTDPSDSDPSDSDPSDSDPSDSDPSDSDPSDSDPSDTAATTGGPFTTGSTGTTGGGAESSSTGGSTGSTGTTGSSDSIGFIDPSETTAGVDECDPYEQDCMAGDKCNAWVDDGGGSWNALGCFPVDADPDAPGQSCTAEGGGTSGIDSCDVGSMCWNTDPDTGVGTCIAMCTGSAAMPSCDDPSTTCIIQNQGVLNLCLPICDPLEQGCPPDEACYLVDDSFVCAPDASGEDSGGEGDPCEFINACDAGFNCGSADSYGGCGAGGCCTSFCDLSEPDTCAVPTHECLAVFDDGEAPMGLEDVGFCGLPA